VVRLLALLRFIRRGSVLVGVGLVGGTVTTAGVVMLVTPGPGLVVIVAGLAILSTKFAWAERALAKVKRHAVAARDKAGRHANAARDRAGRHANAARDRAAAGRARRAHRRASTPAPVPTPEHAAATSHVSAVEAARPEAARPEAARLVENGRPEAAAGEGRGPEAWGTEQDYGATG
jgi:hypothetical protein